MGYRHIQNLYKDQTILMFKEVWALEKIHGTSAHLQFKYTHSPEYLEALVKNPDMKKEQKQALNAQYPGTVSHTCFSGGANYATFFALFDWAKLDAKVKELGYSELTIYGEAYGGNVQKMSHVYGPALKFVVFEVETANAWMDVLRAEWVAQQFELDFVHYVRIPTTLEAIDAERDRESMQAIKNGMGPGHKREGVVLRPIYELVAQGENGGPIRTKHKIAQFGETKTPRQVIVDPGHLKVITDAQNAADEFVTRMRLEHVIDKLQDKDSIGEMIPAMIEDVLREAEGEVINSKELRAAITKKAVTLFKERQKELLIEKTKETC